MSIEKVRAYFASLGIADRIREFTVSSATVELAAAALGCNGAHIAKTMSFMTPDGAILVVAAGDARIDNHKYKGTNRASVPQKQTANRVKIGSSFCSGAFYVCCVYLLVCADWLA